MILLPLGMAVFLGACSQAPGTVKNAVQEAAPTIIQERVQPTIAAIKDQVLETVAPTLKELAPTIKAALTPKPSATPTGKAGLKPTVEPTSPTQY